MSNEFCSQSEQRRIVDRYLGELSMPVDSMTVVERFVEVVSRFPDHEAMRTIGASCTYEELNALSDQTAKAVLADEPYCGKVTIEVRKSF